MPQQSQGNRRKRHKVDAFARMKESARLCWAKPDFSAESLLEIVVGNGALAAEGTVILHSVSSRLHAFLASNEEKFFEGYLESDFPEGRVLNYIATERGLSRKKLYLAFLKRWSLSMQGGEETCVRVSWARPPLKDCKDDLDALVFIARIGISSVLMKLNEAWRYKTRLTAGGEPMMKIDEVFAEKEGTLLLPENDDVIEALYKMLHVDWRGNFKEMESALKSAYKVNLHVVDTSILQAVTLMDEVPFTELHTFQGDHAPNFDCIGAGFELPQLLGLPPVWSPKYRNFSDKDLRRIKYLNYSEGDDLENVENLDLHASFGFDLDREEENLVLSQDPGLTMSFGGEFATINRPPHMANFLRALMSEKCAQGEVLLPPPSTPATDAQEQPHWLQSCTIVDAIVQYSPFEDQTGKLRLVSQAFLHSSLRQLKRKIEDIRVIGSSDAVSFKATVRQGWSEEQHLIKEDVIEDALRLASCRCIRRCGGKSKCPTANEPITFSGYMVKKGTIDLDEARRKLADEGRLRLTKMDPDEIYDDYCEPSNVISCSFQTKEMNLFQLCDIIEKIVVEYNDYGSCMEGDPVMAGYYLRRAYHVSNNMTSKQFLRSIFLVLGKSLAATAMTETGKVSIGKAKANISDSHGSQFSRMNAVYRFSAEQLGKLEISLDEHSSDNMDWY